MKKILAILLAAVMAFSMAISVAAADVSGKIDEAEGVVSDVYDAASDAYGEATGIHDSIQAGDCDEAVSGAFSFAKALANAIHTLVHRLSDLFDFNCPFCDGTGLDKDEPAVDDEPQFDPDAVLVANEDQLHAALAEGGKIVLTDDIVLSKQIFLEKGVKINLNMNGKTISLPDGADDSCDPMIRMAGGQDVNNLTDLTIDGNGTFDLGANPGFSFIAPLGNLTINSGTFKIDPGLSSYGSFFIGINGGVGKLVINGGYFDGGYYVPGDCFNNCRNLLNASWGQSITVYGGTFVGQNPAWGDEGMAFLCTCCGGNDVYCQGTFLEGQSHKDTTMPAGYTITEGTTPDGRPTYTVSYSK